MEIINLGVGGATSEEILRDQLPKAIEFNPDLVILLSGTNDLLYSKKLTSIERWQKATESMLKELTSRKIQVILLSIPPCNEEYLFLRHKKECYSNPDVNGQICLANTILSNLAIQYHAYIVDLHKLVLSYGPIGEEKSLLRNMKNSNLHDGVHLTKIGYDKLADLIVETMNLLFIDGQRIACIGDSLTAGADMIGFGTATGDTYPGRLKEKLGY